MGRAIDPLTRLVIKHGTDKWGPHFYTPIYHGLFARLRDKPIRLLEIGVGGYGLKTSGGASLAMWAEYFPHGQITGIDIVDKRSQTDPRLKLFQGSQDDPVFLKKVSDERGPFDIIILQIEPDNASLRRALEVARAVLKPMDGQLPK